MERHGRTPARRHERGAAMVVTTTLTLVLMGFGLTVMTAVQNATQEHASSKAQLQRLSIAEAGLRAAILNLSLGGDGNVGTAGAPQPFGGGTFQVAAVDNGDNSYTLTARGTYLGGRRVLQALVRSSGHVFNHAIYAGNSSGDLNYAIDLGGFGSEADQIDGSVYSGNDVTVWGDAAITGAVRAGGTITGATGEEGASQPPFDFSGMDYETLADVDVASEFAAHGSSAASAAGGTAIQVPASLESHFLRKNPSDRTTETSGTVKDDYFLEDPYEPVGIDRDQDGSDPYEMGLTVEAGATGYRRLFYIDGNLWLHSNPSFSFRFPSIGADGTQITFIVRGNIYFSDNLFLANAQKDGVAFIALRDEAVSDSGNIYFGDPRGGTLESMHAFMYAENDFHDNHMDASGSRTVEVVGTMAAGNHVSINRTFESHHSRLTVTPDTRLGAGGLDLPGIPQQTQSLQWEVVTWIEVGPEL